MKSRYFANPPNQAPKYPAYSAGISRFMEWPTPGTTTSRQSSIAADIAYTARGTMTCLIGMREGQSILWPDRDGQQRRLSIVKVRRAA